jgi:hypothetical protein
VALKGVEVTTYCLQKTLVEMDTDIINKTWPCTLANCIDVGAVRTFCS